MYFSSTEMFKFFGELRVEFLISSFLEIYL